MTRVRFVLVGLLACGLLAGTAAAAKPVAKSSAMKFSGKTSQGKPISFTLAANGKRITALKLGFHLTCPSGMQPIDVPLARFGKTGTATVAGGAFKAVDTASSVSGTIAGKTAHGAISLKASISSGGSCTSGAVTWSATG